MTGRRVTGRILSLGFPLPGPRVDNYNFLTAPSFFDYDAIVVDVSSLASLIEGICDGSSSGETFSGAAVGNSPDAPIETSLRGVLARRRDETSALLVNGGAVVCFASPARDHAAIAGGDSMDDYCWLPDALGRLCRSPSLQPADGTQADVVDYQHPMAAFVVGQQANIAYRARFDESPAHGVSVFVRSRGGAAIGVELPSESGCVVMLPALGSAPAGDARYTLSDSLQAGIRRLVRVIGEGREPPWAAAYAVPGLQQRADALAEAQQAHEESQRALEAAESQYNELARFRRLLWQEGSAGLDEVVLAALRLIGLDVFDRDRGALKLRASGALLLLEIESSEHSIDLAPHYRLRQRIERAIERGGDAPRGLLIVNGKRSTRPDAREREVSDALRVASETMRYCVAPSHTLFAAVVSQLSGHTETVRAYRESLLLHDGVLAVESHA